MSEQTEGADYFGPQLPKTAANLRLLTEAMRAAGEVAKRRFRPLARTAVVAARGAEGGGEDE
jgi:hypothetical protein